MLGYHGKFLVINLSNQEITDHPLDEDILRKFIGGVGLGTYLLYKYCPTGIDPLDPANTLIFTCSPLVGTNLTTSSKFAVVTKSPLTGFIGDSLSSSFMATELKKTGYDALIITGKCPFPVLLSINNSSVQFLNANHLLGLSTSDTEQKIKEDLGNQIRVACIGPAGENLVRIASISNDGGRHAGRTGPGAVMGSKNLKAIAVSGSNVTPVHNPEMLNTIRKNLSYKSLGPSTQKYRSIGTISNMAVFNRLGVLPTQNFQQSTFKDSESISGEHFHEAHLVKNAHCANCTIGCEKILTTTDNLPNTTSRLEYETAFALGPLVGISNPNTIIRASHLCNEVGIDVISAGSTIAWAMECWEKGIINIRDTNGVKLEFGNEEALMSCLSMIANRDGFGDVLAEGSRIASRIMGHNSETWAMHVKGLEMPGYEPRSLKTMALGLAVSTRGACHNRSSAYEADFSSKVNRFEADSTRGPIAMESEDFSAVLDSLIWCKFLRKSFDDFFAESATIYECVTGWEITDSQLKQTGERINNLKKMFNIREGWTHEDDTLPPRVLNEKLITDSKSEIGLSKTELDIMIQSYYRARGWDENGMIPDEKLSELDILKIVNGTTIPV